MKGRKSENGSKLHFPAPIRDYQAESTISEMLKDRKFSNGFRITIDNIVNHVLKRSEAFSDIGIGINID
ncbi:hypothetical protein N7517_000284 [Penicillium concentricum]|uniref:Uncharacterized protein n=1 Tax=Penicillium concentricum TaxID=293559 RepID=A0A9W9VHG4_9EURO|nr:uncharacterized protein N7517_000284 [Penicillium concentricum]KAJ5382373.1 hypothetical protein N7517_000284 [Penicillium concentricum]